MRKVKIVKGILNWLKDEYSEKSNQWITNENILKSVHRNIRISFTANQI